MTTNRRNAADEGWQSARASAQSRSARAVEIGIVDPLPMVRLEVRRALDAAGFATVDNPSDVPSFLRARRDRAAVVALSGRFGLAELDRALRANRRASVITLVDSASPALFAELLRRRQVYPALRSSNPQSIASTVVAALSGVCSIPQPIAQRIVEQLPADNGTGLTQEELSWLRQLAAGARVDQLAVDARVSERTLYRRLSGAYLKLGVDSRTPAIVRLAQLGVLDYEPATPSP